MNCRRSTCCSQPSDLTGYARRRLSLDLAQSLYEVTIRLDDTTSNTDSAILHSSTAAGPGVIGVKSVFRSKQPCYG
jgi:hypothetical protein